MNGYIYIYHCSAVLVGMYNKWMCVCSVIMMVQNDCIIIWWNGYGFSSKQNGYIKLNYCAYFDYIIIMPEWIGIITASKCYVHYL